MSAFQRDGVDSSVAQPSRDALTDLRTLLADHDRRASAISISPLRDRGAIATHRAGDKTRISQKILIRTNVDKRGALGSADQATRLSGEIEAYADMRRP